FGRSHRWWRSHTPALPAAPTRAYWRSTTARPTAQLFAAGRAARVSTTDPSLRMRELRRRFHRRHRQLTHLTQPPQLVLFLRTQPVEAARPILESCIEPIHRTRANVPKIHS